MAGQGPRPAAMDARGRRFVDAVNAADSAAADRILQEVFAPSTLQEAGTVRLRGLLARLRERMGALEFHHAEATVVGQGEQARASLHVFVRSGRDSTWKDLQFQLEPAPPHRVRNLVFVADVSEPIYLPNGEITQPATLAWLDAYVDKLAEQEDLAGGLLLAQGDRVIFERYFGHADSTRRRRIGPQTRFGLASGGKMFTALLVAQLIEQGRLKFDDTLARHVPALAAHAFAHTVTVGQLLSHTSGLGEYWTDDYERHWNETRTLSDFMPFVLAAGTRFAPGTRFEYSNSNYIVAGLLVEALTGQPYDRVAHDRLWVPLGMTRTGLFFYDPGDTTQAARLSGRARRWRPAKASERGSSAGGSLSTLRDMLRFARALVAGQIVSPGMLRQMTQSKTDGLPESAMSYGYGFELQRTPGGVESFGHGGQASGANFELRYFPGSDLTLIAFSNQDNGAYDDLRRNATRLITGQR